MFCQTIGVWPSSQNSLIKSIQVVEVTIGAASNVDTTTLANTVVPENCLVLYNGQSAIGLANERDYHMGTINLIDGDTVQAKTYSAETSDGSGEVDRHYRCTVIEFQDWCVKYSERGEITISGAATSGNVTLGQAVDRDNLAISHCGQRFEGTTQSVGAAFAGLSDFAGSQTLTASRNNTQSNWELIVSYSILEFVDGIVQGKQDIGYQISGGSSTTDRVITESGTWLRENCWFIHAGMTMQGGFQAEQAYQWMDADKAYFAERDSSAATGVTMYPCILHLYPKWLNNSQHGVVTIAASNTTGDSAITSVNTGKTAVSWLGMTTDNPFANIDRGLATINLESATVVRGERDLSATNYIEIGYNAVEFI